MYIKRNECQIYYGSTSISWNNIGSSTTLLFTQTHGGGWSHGRIELFLKFISARYSNQRHKS